MRRSVDKLQVSLIEKQRLRAGVTPVIRVRTMMAQDIPLGMRLKTQAGWNQTEQDWRRLLALEPEGCFVGQWDGCDAATTCTSCFASVGWISMVLVDGAFRGRGLARHLMQRALEYLAARQIKTVRLDATPLGRPVYEKLGFQCEYELIRWEGTVDDPPLPTDVRALQPADPPGLVALDRQATGTDRTRLIEQFCSEHPAALRLAVAGGQLAGYVWRRRGINAVQLGPLVAAQQSVGSSLAAAALQACGGHRVFWDIPRANEAATRMAESLGFTRQRQLTRMFLGQPLHDLPQWIWASFGPEKG